MEAGPSRGKPPLPPPPLTKPKGLFKALRRLHGEQNLESRGLNDLSDAFQNFVTRARFFSVGRLRRTWSHSAVEFMKYRKLLPMLLADGDEVSSEAVDDFDISVTALATAKARSDERKVVVTNVSPRVTSSQLISFFTQFGKVSSCHLPREESRRQTSRFATLPKNPRNCGVATITFKTTEDAQRAKNATSEQLRFYDQVMVVSQFSSRRRPPKEEEPLSRASSTQSLQAISASLCLDDFPSNVLQRLISFLPLRDAIRFERINKAWLEAATKSWRLRPAISFASEAFFSKTFPLRDPHLRAVLQRAGAHLRSLDLSSVCHLLDDDAPLIISEYCKELHDLDLSGLRAPWQSWADLSDSLGSLQVLCLRDSRSLGEKCFWHLLKGTTSLRRADFRGCRRLRGRCFRLFTYNLRELLLDGCVRVDPAAIEDLCLSATGLRELRLSECFLLNDLSISMLSRCLPELEVLSLCGEKFEGLTVDGLLHISRMPRLQELALDFNEKVGDEVVEALCAGLSSLKTLSLANAGFDSTLTSFCLQAIPAHMEELDLSSLAAVTGSSLSALVKQSPRLSVLQLRNCVFLSDEGVRALASLRNLRHCDLSGSLLITTAAVQDVANAFPAQVASQTVTLVVGGTQVDVGQLRLRSSRVRVDPTDYSALLHSSSTMSSSLGASSHSDDEDDEFESLTTHRALANDAMAGEEESPVEGERELQQWVEREARLLGLIKK